MVKGWAELTRLLILHAHREVTVTMVSQAVEPFEATILGYSPDHNVYLQVETQEGTVERVSVPAGAVDHFSCHCCEEGE